jgi:hypothetical protein
MRPPLSRSSYLTTNHEELVSIKDYIGLQRFDDRPEGFDLEKVRSACKVA